MKISMYKDNAEYPLIHLKPSEFAKMINGSKCKDVTGFPRFICIYPLPDSEDIVFKLSDNQQKGG